MLQEIKTIAKGAGAKIMEIYQGELGVTYKEDASPLTLADQASHNYICEELRKLFPEIPIISEEGELPNYAQRQQMASFFLVDPLDGTKEFIKRNGEFTVNIALIEGQKPTLGVVYIPAMDQLYAAQTGKGATLTVGSEERTIHASQSVDTSNLSASMSRSHPSETLDVFLKSLGNVTHIPLGSALKFCRVAEGEVDFYPRFGPLMEWDTGAAHVVAEEAGAVVTDLNGGPLLYNKEIVKHQGLICAANPDLSRFLLSKKGS